jgi:tetratricopeptide (TPR) repeat protein
VAWFGEIAAATQYDSGPRDFVVEWDPADFAILLPEKIVDVCSNALSHAENLGPKALFAHYRCRGDAYFQLRRFDLAKRDYDAALKLRPKDCEIRLLRAEVLGHRSLPDCTAEIEQILEDNPKFAPGYAALGTIALYGGELSKAVQLATAAIACDPEAWQAYGVRAHALARLNKLDEALADVNKLIELHPFGVFTERTEQPYRLRSEILRRLGKYRLAADSLQVAMRLDPECLGVAHDLWVIYYYFLQKEEIAFQIADRMRQKWPKDQAAISAYALNALAIGGVDAGYSAAKEGVANDPQCSAAHSLLATMHIAREEYAEALAQCDEALRLDESNIDALRTKILLLASCPDARVRKGSAARELAYKLCVAMKHNEGSSMLCHAIANAECGDFEKAVETVKGVLLLRELSPATRELAERLLKLFQDRIRYRFDPSEGGLSVWG